MIYLYKNEFEEVYKADVGNISKIIDLESVYNNKLVYREEGTLNGYCFKDYKIFENNPDDICYIAECQFEDTLLVDYVNENKEKLINEGVISTANSIRKEVRDHLIYNEYFYEYQKNGIVYTIEAKKFDDKIINKIANEVFDMVDWQCTSSYIYETDWNEWIKQYYDEKNDIKSIELC